MSVEAPISFDALESQPPVARESQTAALFSYYAQVETSPSATMVYGPASSGKSRTLVYFCEILDKWRTCYIDCRKLAYCACIYQHVLRRLNMTANMSRSCDSLNDFVAWLRVMSDKDRATVLIFDHIDQVKDAPPSLVETLVDLPYLIGHDRLSCILSARNRTRLDMPTYLPAICFPAYTDTELVEVLSLFPPQPKFSRFYTGDENAYVDQDGDEVIVPLVLWQRFCSTLTKTLGVGIPPNVGTYLNIAYALWPRFVEPVLRHEYDEDDFLGLFRVARQDNLFTNDVPVVYELNLSAQENEKNHANYLSLLGAFMLIAAYLASYVSPKLDARLFSRASDRIVKRKRRQRRSNNPNATTTKATIPQTELGPRMFELDRLLAIFRAITQDLANLDHCVDPFAKELIASSDILCHLANIRALRLVASVAPATSSENIGGRSRWRALVTYDFVKRIARQCNFDIDPYLNLEMSH